MSKVIANLEVVVKGKNISVVQKDLKKTKQEMDGVESSAKKTGKQIDKTGREIKGVAGISSGASKNFSKMQQNLGGSDGSGGLVRAYALLAANVFALTAAFGVLQRAARIDQLTQSMEILSTRGGTSIDVLSQRLVEASGGAVDLAAAFSQVSLASSAGLSTTEIEGLTQVAKGAAISLGRDLPDALDRIFRGAIKLEPEILDEIGLFVRVDEASRIYAAQLGKTANSLSQAEKRQAFLNQILEQGTKKFQEYAEEVEPDAFTRLAASLRDISINLTGLVTGTIGPLVGFLADNKAILTTIFVVVAGTLLKLAVPALGQFNSRIAEGAALAAEDAQKYIKSVENKANANTKAEREIAKNQRKTAREAQKRLETEDKITPRFRSQAKAAKDINKEIAEANTLTRKKNALEKRVALLKQAELKAGDKSKKIIKDELALLNKKLKLINKELSAEKKLNAIGTGKLKAREGSFAARQLEGLQQRAAVSSGVADVTGIAETQGLSAAFGDLKTKIKETKIPGTTKNISFMGKVSLATKGSIGILGVGVQNLGAAITSVTMKIAPFIAIATTLFQIFATGKEEARALNEQLDESGKISSKLRKRFETQVTATENANLSFLEQTKALIAFNKQSSETTDQVLQITKKFNEFNDAANGLQRAYQGVLRVFGQDLETKSLEEVTTLIDERLMGAFRLEGVDSETVNRFVEAGAISREYADGLLAAADANKVLSANSEEVNNLNREQREALDRASRLTRRYGSLTAAAANNNSNAAFLEKLRSEGLLDLFKSQISATNALEKANEATKEGVTNLEAASAAAREDNIITTERTKRLTALQSAIEGGNDAVQKFQQGFLTKTKVDEILGSLNGIKDSFGELTKDITVTDKESEDFGKVLATGLDADKLQEFFKDFDAQDNAIKSLFSTEQINQIKEFSKSVDTIGEASEIFTEVTEQVQEFQFTVINSKQVIAGLNQELKIFNKVAKVGMDTGKQTVQNQIDIASENLKIVEANKNMLLLGKDLEQDDINKIKNAKTAAELSEIAAKFKITEQEALAIANADEQVRQKALEEAILLEQKSTLEKQKQAQASKIILDQKQKEVKAEQELRKAQTEFAAAARGVAIDPSAQIRNELKAAKEEADFKQANLKLEATLQEIQFTLLKEELNVLAAREVISEQEKIRLQTALTESSQTVGNALRTQAEAAGTIFSSKVARGLAVAGGTAAGGGVGIAGVRSIGAASEARQDRIAELEALEDPTEAQKKELEMLQNLNVQYLTLTNTIRGYGAELAKLGPEGELASQFIAGTMAITDGFQNMQLQMQTVKKEFQNEDGSLVEGVTKFDFAMAKGAATAEFASSVFQGIGQMMAASSQNQIANIDQQIEAEKKRDGKSAESLAKIKSLEQKKDAMARKAFNDQKKVQMATTIANTAAAVMGSLAPEPIGLGPVAGIPLAIMHGVMGAMQLAIISRQKYKGASSDTSVAKPGALNIGKRDSRVDISQSASAGELAFLRGARGMGTNANNFTPAAMGRKGYAMGRRGYAEGGEGIVVGERGPEVISPATPVDVTPNFALGGGTTNVSFTIHAMDGKSVQDMLYDQQGNIIRMIREAANDNGDNFLETVDANAYNGTNAYGGDG